MNENIGNTVTDILPAGGDDVDTSVYSGNDSLSIPSSGDGETADTDSVSDEVTGDSSENNDSVNTDSDDTGDTPALYSELSVDYTEILTTVTAHQEQTNLLLTMILLFLVLVWTEKKLFLIVKNFAQGKERR